LIDLHQHPPMTLRRLRARYGWILPLTAVLFVLLAVGARFDTLPWDAPIFDAVVDARTPWLVSLARRVSFLGSTPVVLTVAALAALLAWRRCQTRVERCLVPEIDDQRSRHHVSFGTDALPRTEGTTYAAEGYAACARFAKAIRVDQLRAMRATPTQPRLIDFRRRSIPSPARTR
jgi:hypothetical protein